MSASSWVLQPGECDDRVSVRYTYGNKHGSK